MKALVALLAVLVPLAGAAPPVKAAGLSNQVHEVLLVVFQSIGPDADGMVRPREADEMIRQTYGAMDVNHDGRVTLDEFKAFIMSFEYLAQVRGKLAPFAAAKDAIFRRWDADKSGVLTFQDYRAGILGDFTRAAGKDGTSDLKLSLDEIKSAAFIRELTEAIR